MVAWEKVADFWPLREHRTTGPLDPADTDGQSINAQVRQLTKAKCKKVFRAELRKALTTQ